MSKMIKPIIFVLIAVLLLAIISLLLRPRLDGNAVTKTFYSAPENSMDGVYIGASTVYNNFNGGLAFRNYGAAIFGLCMSTHPLGAYQYWMKEIERTQKPQLYIIDLVISDLQEISDSAATNPINSMRFSTNRSELIKSLYEGIKQEERLSYWEYEFDFLRYHYAIRNILSNVKALIGGGEVSVGFIPTFGTMNAQVKPSYEAHNAAPVPPGEFAEKKINELLDYCDILDTEVLFVMPPNAMRRYENEAAKKNYVMELIRKRGYEVMDMYNYAEEFNFDWSEDMRDDAHMNQFGAEKYTNWFAPYLMEQYGLPDRRGENQYGYYETAYRLTQDASIKDIANRRNLLPYLLKAADSPPYSVLIAYSFADIMSGETVNALKGAGLSDSFFNPGKNIALLENQSVVFSRELILEKYTGAFIDGSEFSFDATDSVTLYFNCLDREKLNIYRGLKVIVYNNDTHSIVTVAEFN